MPPIVKILQKSLAPAVRTFQARARGCSCFAYSNIGRRLFSFGTQSAGRMWCDVLDARIAKRLFVHYAGRSEKNIFAACLLTAGQAIFLLPMIRSGLASREKREGEIA